MKLAKSQVLVRRIIKDLCKRVGDSTYVTLKSCVRYIAVFKHRSNFIVFGSKKLFMRVRGAFEIFFLIKMSHGGRNGNKSFTYYLNSLK